MGGADNDMPALIGVPPQHGELVALRLAPTLKEPLSNLAEELRVLRKLHGQAMRSLVDALEFADGLQVDDDVRRGSNHLRGSLPVESQGSSEDLVESDATTMLTTVELTSIGSSPTSHPSPYFGAERLDSAPASEQLEVEHVPHKLPRASLAHWHAGSDPSCFTQVLQVRELIRDGFARSLEDPREVFHRHCEDTFAGMSEDEFISMLNSLAPGLSSSLATDTWEAFDKDPEGRVSYQAFSKACMHVRSQSLMPRGSIAQPHIRESVADTDREEPAVVLTEPPGPTEDEIKQRLLAYRFGRALKTDSDSTEAFLDSCDELEGFTLKELMQECRRLQVPLSKREMEDLFQLWTGSRPSDQCALIRPEVLRSILAVSDGKAPEDYAWLRRAVAAAGIFARSIGGTPLGMRLARIGGTKLFAEEAQVRNIFWDLEPLDEDVAWQRALLALDKREDGQIMLEPLVQWAAGIGVADAEVLETEAESMEAADKEPAEQGDLFDFLEMTGTERCSLHSLESELFSPHCGGASFLPPVREDLEEGEEDSEGGELWNGGLNVDVNEELRKSKLMRCMKKKM